MTSHRRPSAQDIESNVVCMLGAEPIFLDTICIMGNQCGRQYTTLNEVQRSAVIRQSPIKSYDFEAPISECGKVNDSFGAIRKWNLFVQDLEKNWQEMEVFFQKSSRRERKT